MQKGAFVQSDFSRGELSRRLDGRFDLPFYYQGASKLRNMVTLPQGGATRMPGTLYMGQAKYGDRPCRLIPFQPNPFEKYILEVGDLYTRFWQSNGQLMSGESPVELYLPYNVTDIYLMQFAHSKDSLYLCKRVNPILLIRKEQSSFTFHTLEMNQNLWNSQISYKAGDTVYYQGSYYKAKYDNTGIQPGAVAYWQKLYELSRYTSLQVTSIQTHNPSLSYPPDSFVLSYWAMGNKTYIYNATKGRTVPPGTSLDAEYAYTGLIKRRYWYSVISIDGNITNISSWSSTTQYQTGDYCILNNVLYKALAANQNIQPESYFYQYWEKIDENKKSIFPISITFMDRRLICAGNNEEGQSILGSKIGEYSNINIGTRDDDAFQFVISADKEGTIQWAIAQDNLLIGTTNGEYLVTGGGRPITPTNVQVLRQSSYGSAPVRAIVAGDAVLFVQKGGRKVREFVYSDDKKTYQAPDLTIFADHVTESGIVQWDYQQSPYPVVWAVLANGKLIGLTYDRISNVWGWHVHETDGSYESVCVQDGDAGEDEVWVVVRRTVNGQTVRTIEKFAPFEFSTIQEAHFVHCGVYYPPAPEKSITNITQDNPAQVTCPSHGLSNGDRIRIWGVQGMERINHRVYCVANVTTHTFTLLNESGLATVDSSSFDAYTGGGVLQKVVKQFSGLSHLVGKQVCAFADGAAYEDLLVDSNGTVTLPNWVSWARIGLPYTSLLKSMRLGKGELKRIHKLRILFYKTIGSLFGPDETELKELNWRETGEDVSKPPQLFTGYKETFLRSTYDREPYIVLANDKPLPFTVLSVQAEAGVYG